MIAAAVDWLVCLLGVNGLLATLALVVIGIYAEIHWRVRDE